MVTLPRLNFTDFMDIYEMLRRDEGVRLKPYVDTAGKITIGVGRNLTDVGISNDESNILLQNDISKTRAGLIQYLPVFSTMDPIRQAVPMNMAFNLGVGGFLEFHNMIAFLQAGNWDSAAAEMLNSRWASEVGVRATRLAEQLRTGQWV
jgi:lysozyme